MKHLGAFSADVSLCDEQSIEDREEHTLMNAIERIGKCGLVPVVVIENPDDAIPTAKAILDGGIDVMEITLRTEAGLQAIKDVRKAYPQMLVGAGTVLNMQQLEAAIEADAQFIVSPGFNPAIVQRCIDLNVTVTPGCVTPTEIEEALSYGLKVLKFFPADVYGGIKGCAALYGPYKSTGIRFMPTGGVNLENLAEYATKPFIHAAGGSWFCKSADITAHRFEAITADTTAAVDALLGFELAHVGINAANSDDAMSAANLFVSGFHFKLNQGTSSFFAGSGIEITKVPGLGQNGHIAIKTNDVERSVYYLAKKGFEVDELTAKFKGETLIAIYLRNEIGGFAIHLLQR